MGFIMEFAENLVLKLMEDPKERDRKFREHVYAVKDRCGKTKEMWSYPLRPYGFWTFERHNAQLRWDAQISQVPGRRDPYDDVLQQSYKIDTRDVLSLFVGNLSISSVIKLSCLLQIAMNDSFTLMVINEISILDDGKGHIYMVFFFEVFMSCMEL
ncbi:hypothetical protein G4B88_006161 [Cannabis sativa]|uniref:Uncharacterized protein n=1 Tax=Cannabis sativa TaxID=3483 RepID=A0A7J6IC61_CANSA|nr:hypothetical protein G4B88_006161 [Cannabis sativa]